MALYMKHPLAAAVFAKADPPSNLEPSLFVSRGARDLFDRRQEPRSYSLFSRVVLLSPSDCPSWHKQAFQQARRRQLAEQYRFSIHPSDPVAERCQAKAAFGSRRRQPQSSGSFGALWVILAAWALPERRALRRSSPRSASLDRRLPACRLDRRRQT